MQSRSRKRDGLILALTAAMFSTACTTTSTINRTKEFAQAGITFSDSLGPVLDQSLEAKVRANSMTLEAGRKQALDLCAGGDTACLENVQDTLEAALQEQTAKETQRVQLYRRFRLHAQVLRNYFQTLSSLATSEQPDALGQSAQRLVTQASALRRAIVADAPEIDFGNVPQILTSQVASTFRSKALQKVLQETAPAISVELALQEALLDNLVAQTSSDLALAFQQQDDEKINDPFVMSTKPLPADWAARRFAAARRGLALNAVDAARKAAGTLRTAFDALVENRLDAESLGGLIQDLNNLATLALEIDRAHNQRRQGGVS